MGARNRERQGDEDGDEGKDGFFHKGCKGRQRVQRRRKPQAYSFAMHVETASKVSCRRDTRLCLTDLIFRTARAQREQITQDEDLGPSSFPAEALDSGVAPLFRPPYWS